METIRQNQKHGGMRFHSLSDDYDFETNRRDFLLELSSIIFLFFSFRQKLFAFFFVCDLAFSGLYNSCSSCANLIC